MKRLPDHAATIDDIVRYFTHRARQGLVSGWVWSGEINPTSHDDVVWGARTLTTSPDGVVHQSLYVLDAHTGRGHFTRYMERNPIPIVTAPSCAIEEFLKARSIAFRVVEGFATTTEYQAVSQFYGDRRARRSGAFYMNHIDEGLGVLARIEASDAAKRAYCLHPLVQLDGDLAANFGNLEQISSSMEVVALALEYRNIANSYLSAREDASPDGPIVLSPLTDVNDMLRADKVQNYKDFLLYHATSHPRAAVLDRYFRRWLLRLGVSIAWFEELQQWLDLEAHVRVTEPLEV